MAINQNLEQRRAALTEAQRVMLDQRLKGVTSTFDAGVIPRRLGDDPAPLSYSQQRLWFLDRLMPGTPVYNEQMTLPIRFPLNHKALAQAIAEIGRRHEVLRTVYINMDGGPVQVVRPDLSIPLTFVDLRGYPPGSRRSQAERQFHDEVRRPFDLETGPPLRTTLVQLGDPDYLLLITMHHIVWDGWSSGVFIKELTALYTAFAAGTPSPLPELPIQYADFAVWQRSMLQDSLLEGLLTYWRQQLEALPALQLPSDFTRPPMPSFRGAVHTFRISAGVTQAIKLLSQRLRITFFMCLLATFAVLLHRYTDQEEIVIGMPTANRHRARELEGLIGFFVNTLVLRIDVSKNPSFLELLERVREVTLGAQEHQDLPFEKLVEELHPNRDLSRNPLCQVAFQLLNMQPAGPDSDGDMEAPFSPSNGTAKFDLRLDIGEQGGGLFGNIEYSLDLFRADTVTRMASHFQTLLEAVAAAPEKSLSDLPILTATEQEALFVQGTGARVPFPGTCIHHMVEQHAREPSAVAIVFEDQAMTFGELNARANQLAHHLRKVGVRSESLVGLYVHRSPEMFVGLLGILKAGGAYLPLDPAYPLERLQFMVQDAGARVLLTQRELAGKLAGDDVVEICLDADWDSIALCESSNPDDCTSPDALAYVIYTSGSTGIPKGVMVEHRGLMNVAQAQRDIFGLDAGSRVLQFTSLSFDASIFEAVMSFYNGATLFTGGRESLMPGPPLAAFLRNHAITICTLPPSALAVLPYEAFPALKTILVAGEACPASLVSLWAPERAFFNLYGPTEATIWTTYAQCTSGDVKPPIGRPIPNTLVRVLDRNLKPVPAGVKGELWIGGVGVARGYLHRSELTAERFAPDPFGEPGTRLYRTGDQVRVLADGNLEFLGRVDRQTKVRGFRIEPDEVEVVLAGHPGVREAAVTVWEDALGDPYLAAYVVLRSEGVTIEFLQDYMRRKLPDYMVPSRLMVLPVLPLTPNGKVDRSALPRPEAGSRAGEMAYVPPQTRAEQLIATVWQDVLGLDRVGLNDNFFDLGGHSLLLARVHSRLTELSGSDITLVDLFRYPTVSLLAERLGEAAVPEPRAASEIERRAEMQWAARRRRRERLANTRDD